jgi:acetyltransferase-like isoleucine patch superfamily enzyme
MGALSICKKYSAKATGLLFRRYLKLIGVECGLKLKLTGLPFIYPKGRGTIRIGCGVRMVSSELGNALGVNHRCILRTLNPKATIEIGDGVQMSGATIAARERVVIGKNVFLGANTTVIDSDMHPFDPVNRIAGSEEGIATSPVFLEENVWLGMNAIVMKGVTIGRNTIVGAGSVVVKSLPANVIAAGNPAKIIRTLE